MENTVQWFEVDLERLQLQAVELDKWPDGMTAGTRMQEECLESVVAFNLDTLFPGEDLLLARVGGTAWRASDILAVDPFGYLRVMELKKTQTSRGDLENQVISYGINRAGRPPWQEQLAQALPYLPEHVDLRLEGFKVNGRTRTAGGAFVKRHAPEILDRAWDRYDRFDKAHLLANTLRISRGAAPGPPAYERSAVADVIYRIYGVPLVDLSLSDPGEGAQQIVDETWGGAAPEAGTEFTIVAPGLSRRVEDAIPLEERGADFNLVDADLRHAAGPAGVERALLRWHPVHRTIPTRHVRTATALRNLLRDSHPEAGLLQYRSSSRRFYWNDFRHMFMGLEENESGDPIAVTGFDALTEGLAEWKPRWRAGMRKLRQTLPDQNDSIRRGGGDRLVAPWDIDNLRPAAALFAAYYDMLEEQGVFDLDKNAWYRRPTD